MNWIDRLAAVEELEDAGLDCSAGGRVRARSAPRGGSRDPFLDPDLQVLLELRGERLRQEQLPRILRHRRGLRADVRPLPGEDPRADDPGHQPRDARSQGAGDGRCARISQGFLLSGGSNRRNEIRYERYFPVIEKLKRDFPHLKIAIHSALLDEARARAMAAAGVDTAMMDVIGARETISEVYHLDRPVEDFEATLAALCATAHGSRAAYRHRPALRAHPRRGQRARHREPASRFTRWCWWWSCRSMRSRGRSRRRQPTTWAGFFSRHGGVCPIARCCWAAPGRPACTAGDRRLRGHGRTRRHRLSGRGHAGGRNAQSAVRRCRSMPAARSSTGQTIKLQRRDVVCAT